jgi:hypothetical protein
MIPTSCSSIQRQHPVPENATKLCDRTRQEGEFVRFYHEMREKRPGSPQVYIVVEDDLDRPEFLLDRLVELRIAPLAVSVHGHQRGTWVRQSREYAYGSLRILQLSANQSIFSSFDLPVPDQPLARALFNDPRLNLYSHIVSHQIIDGERAYTDAYRFVDWFINDFWAAYTLELQKALVRSASEGLTQWLVFLVFRFSSLNPRNVTLREQLLKKLKRLFGPKSQVNIDPRIVGVPCLLLPQPDPLSAVDVADVLAVFPFSSVAERNRTAKAIYAQLQANGGMPRMDDVVQRLERLRRDYMRTGAIQI